MEPFCCSWRVKFMIKQKSESDSPCWKTYTYQISAHLEKVFFIKINSPSRSKIVLERLKELFNSSTSPFDVQGRVLMLMTIKLRLQTKFIFWISIVINLFLPNFRPFGQRIFFILNSLSRSKVVLERLKELLNSSRSPFDVDGHVLTLIANKLCLQTKIRFLLSIVKNLYIPIFRPFGQQNFHDY